MNRTYDVIVIGGGVSGSAAAVSAARCGARTLIIENEGYLGGSLTGCGVGPMMTYHTGSKQIIKGFMEELVEELVRRGQSTGHIRDTLNCVSYQTPFNAEGLKLLLDQKCAEAGVDVLFHTMLASATIEDKEIKEIIVCNKAGLSTYKAKIYIDATGDADLAVKINIPTVIGKKGKDITQPMTMNMKYCNVNSEKLRKAVLESDKKEFPSMNLDISTMKNTPYLALGGFGSLFKEENEKGELHIPRDGILIFETERKGEYIVNTTRINKLSPVDPMDLSNAEIIGRKQCAELDKFLRKNIPGFENALLEFTGPKIGVRSSRQIVGKHVITEEDLFSKKRFPDTICHAAYPIDVHSPSDETTYRKELKPGDFYSIPYSSLYSETVSNYLTCGRSISSTFEAQSAIRVTPIAGSTGQAAGVAAAIAVEDNTDVQSIDVKKLQRVLKSQGAFLED